MGVSELQTTAAVPVAMLQTDSHQLMWLSPKQILAIPFFACQGDDNGGTKCVQYCEVCNLGIYKKDCLMRNGLS